MLLNNHAITFTKKKNKVEVEIRHAKLKTLYHCLSFNDKQAEDFCRELMSFFEHKLYRENEELLNKYLKNAFDADLLLPRPKAGRRLGEEPESA